MVRFRHVRRFLLDHGWEIVRQTGSHEHWKHATLPGTVTVAGLDAANVAPKTLCSIAQQAGCSVHEIVDWE